MNSIGLNATKASIRLMQLSESAKSEYVQLEASKDILDRAGYKAPDNHHIHTGANTLGSGIDTRGEGGFVVVAPSKHKSGGTYNLVEQKCGVEVSPAWLSDLSSESHFQVNGSGNGLNGAVKDRWGDLVDGRESYMVSVILGSIRTWYATKGDIPSLQELVDEAYPTYEMRAKARGDNLDDDGRGLELFTYKCKYQLKRAKNNQLKILHNVCLLYTSDAADE